MQNDPIIPFLGIYPREIQIYTYLHKDFYFNIHSTFIYTRHKLETIQTFINWWKDEQYCGTSIQ